MLLVMTPGLGLDAYRPLLSALRDAGHEVRVVDHPCANQDSAALAAGIARAAEGLPDDTVVVAHGLGATLALMADPELHVERYVLLAPVLAHWPVKASKAVAAASIEGGSHAVELASLGESGRGLAASLLGDEPVSLGCVPGRFAMEVQSWAGGDPLPLDLAGITHPVWMAVSLGDDVAGVEVVVEASRALPDRELVRLGVTRLDPQDYSHLGLLVREVPIRAAVGALR
ncbi:MAG: hypothetical protein R3F61_29140 [Myxococcota bacterium]